MVTRPKATGGTARYYQGANVPMRVIRKFARDVVKQFSPDKIILFGSYAYGTPNDDSDVDILVVMPCRNQLDQAVKISAGVDPPFSLDIIVRKPSEMKWRTEERESFTTEIVTRGKVLYESSDSGMGAQGRKRLPSGVRNRSKE